MSFNKKDCIGDNYRKKNRIEHKNEDMSFMYNYIKEHMHDQNTFVFTFDVEKIIGPFNVSIPLDTKDIKRLIIQFCYYENISLEYIDFQYDNVNDSWELICEIDISKPYLIN